MQLTNEQEAIFAAFRGHQSLGITALAGTGKTTTTTAALAECPEVHRGQRVEALAFNRAAADDLARKVPAGVRASTLHSLGYRLLREEGIRARPDSTLTRREAERVVADMGCPRRIARQVARVVADGTSNAKARMRRGDAVADMLRLTGADITDSMRDAGWGVDRIAEAVNGCLTASYRRLDRGEGLTFDDMVWGPLVLDVVRPLADLVLVDEAQDLNASRYQLAAGICGGRMVMVGDPNQRIYGWNGALPDALGDCARDFGGETLPLTMTWRCGSDIVDVARAVVPEYRARPGAHRGAVTRGGVDAAQPGDMVLARTNAAVMGAALSLVRRGRRAAVVGKDIAPKLVNMLRGAADTTGSRSAVVVIAAARDQATAEAERARADGMERWADQLADLGATLGVLGEGLSDVGQVERRISDLIRPMADPSAVSCMTIHRSKGGEADGVVVLADTLKGEAQGTEEGCVTYVGLSRAKQRLVMSGTGPQRVDMAVEALTAGRAA